MAERKKFIIEKSTFIPTSIILISLLVIGLAFPKTFNSASVVIFNGLTQGFGWLVLPMTVIMTITIIIVAFTPLGNRIIGGKGTKIEYSMFSWIAMTICSAIATAMVFWAVAEPMNHWMNPPVFTGNEPGTPEAAVRAIQIACFHMSFLYYGPYTFWAAICAYLCLNKHLPFRPCTAFYPIFKEKTYGPLGIIVDILSILGLIGGIATSLGIGVTQFVSGLQYLFGVSPSNMLYGLTILFVTLFFTISSLRGLKKGMNIISNVNSYIYIGFLLFLIIAGPTVFQLDLLSQSFGSYLAHFWETAFNNDAFRIGGGWVQNWSIFDFVWYLAYAPCIGLFLAKISKGRTFRQFIIVNVFVPSIFVFVWLTFFGGNAFYQDYFLGGNIWKTIQESGNSIASFALLNLMPLKAITVPALIVVLFFSFVTLADAMTGTIASITLKNATPDEAPMGAKLYWGAIIGGATLICLFALGDVGTKALQCISVALALPLFFLSVPMINVIISIVNGKADKTIDALKAKGFDPSEAIEEEEKSLGVELVKDVDPRVPDSFLYQMYKKVSGAHQDKNKDK